MKRGLLLAAALAAWSGACVAQVDATPAGYWEGTAYNHEIPMKDHVRQLTRTVNADFWFTVKWDPARKVGTVSGEADAKYDSELKVENLPKVTVPAPGGNVKFEPSVGGKLSENDNRRRFPIIGVLRVDPNTGTGTLFLQKVDARTTPGERTNVEAGGAAGYDTPMKFIMRADPGVSAGIAAGGSGVSVSNSGTVSADSGMGASASANVGGGVGVIVKEIPMVPFNPFTSRPGKVAKRPGGPFTASFEERSDKFNTKWTAKQVGGERRDSAPMTPEMQRQLDELMQRIERLERGRR